MKVSALEGSDLAYWVLKAEGARVKVIDGERFVWIGPGLGVMSCSGGWHPVNANYCESWHRVGALIEREGITVGKSAGGGAYAHDDPKAESRGGQVHSGPTYTIAAMRAFVASKFGPEVPGE